MERELLVIKDLSKYYSSGQQVVMALHQLNLSFHRGEFVAITGESGSGKSTLAHVLGGILPYEGGELLVDGAPTSHYDSADWERYRRDRGSFISQDYGILSGSTVLSNVVSALRLVGMDGGAARERAEAVLRQVDLWELRGRRAAKLSSGQKQRLAIARALAKPAPILIADEPTGNLDPENSAAVIRLLAEAAKERLVILITHEFEEAEDFVTRRIVLRDGQVAMDAVLREAPLTPEKREKAPAAKPQKGMGLFIAGLQLRSRPVWSGMMLGLFALTAFALFAFAGTFLANLDDTFTRRYDDSAFRNGNSRRIVVVRPDGEDMTEEDNDALLALPHVEAVERYSYLNDFRYAYLEGEHYEFRYSRDEVGEGVYDVYASVLLEPDAMPFAKTVPLLAEGEPFLTAGRLPGNVYEVVAGDGSLLGQTFPVYLQDEKRWGIDDYLCFEVTVVGVTDYGSGLYFHDHLGRTLTAYLQKGALVYLPVYEGLESGRTLIAQRYYALLSGQLTDKGLAKGQRFRGPWPYTIYAGGDPEAGQAEAWAALPAQDGASVLERQVTGGIPTTLTWAVGVTAEDFEQLVYSGQGNQVSLYLEDYAYTDRVLEAVHALGYAAISPYREGSTVQIEARAEQRMNTLRICCIAFLAILVLQVVALRSMFGLGTESYRLLSHIGLDCKAALRSVYWQVLLFALCGQGVGVGAIFLCGELGVSQVENLLHYLTAAHGVGLSLLHLAASFLTALWSARALRRNVYPNSAQTPDLDWTSWEVKA